MTPTNTGWLVARICEYEPSSGKSICICDGIASTTRELGSYDGLQSFKAQVKCYPVAMDVPAGRSLRVHVASAAFPRWAPTACFKNLEGSRGGGGGGGGGGGDDDAVGCDILCSSERQTMVTIPTGF